MHMNHRIARFSLALVLSLSAACKSDPAPTAPPSSVTAAPSAPAAEGHASAKAEPGSHDDWCEEHGVPESQCTRCNPSLIAAFKATGDWCEEHGVPESQCVQCNPALKIERPPKKGAAQ
ncbi:MAG TPA: hypothetical protein VMG12_39185 [Polyangiaceae bacterium]|nr:hypothetical protein [Polyangiaceae bacterium]